MAMGRMIRALFLMCACAGCVYAQDASPPPSSVPAPAPAANPAADADPVLTHRPTMISPPAAKPLPKLTVPLVVLSGTALQVVLDKEVHVEKVGQLVHGRVAEAVYAFDQVVVPVGAEVIGEVTQLESESAGKRTLDFLNAEFTPARKVQLEFKELVLSDGRHIAIHSTVPPGSGQVIQFLTAGEADKKKGVKDTASEKAKQAREETKRQWDDAMKQVHEPGKIHKLERYAESQSPVHRQFIDAGTVYFAELREPLDFG